MTDTDPLTTPCSRCQAPILEEDFDQGFAVRAQDNSNAVCKLCVDSGVTQEEVAIKRAQIRAQIQQQNIYRYSDGKNPQLNRFTFLTAGHIALHRRVAQDQGEFNPPELSSDDSAETQEFTKRDQTTRESTNTRGTRNHSKKSNKKDNRETANKKAPLLIGIAAGALAIIIVLAVVIGGGSSVKEPTEDDTADHIALTSDTHDTVPSKKYARNDFSKDALIAWDKAHTLLESDDPLRGRIEDELSSHIAKNLKRIRESIDHQQGLGTNIETHVLQQQMQQNLQQLQKVIIPTQRSFERLNEVKRNLDSRLKQTLRDIKLSQRKASEIEHRTIENSENRDTQNKTPLKLPYKVIFEFNCDTITNNKIISSDASRQLDIRNGHCNDKGISGQSLYLGKNASASIAMPGFIYPKEFTLSFYIKTARTNNTKNRIIYAHGTEGSTESDIESGTKNTINITLKEMKSSDSLGFIKQYVGGLSNHYKIRKSEDGDLLDGQWHHYLLTSHAETGINIYIDGSHAFHQQQTIAEITPSNEKVFIGSPIRESAQDTTIHGYIDDIVLAQGQPSDFETYLATVEFNLSIANNDNNPSVTFDNSDNADGSSNGNDAGESTLPSGTPNTVAECKLHSHLRDHNANCGIQTEHALASESIATAIPADHAVQSSAWRLQNIEESAGAQRVLTADFNGDGFLDILYSQGNKNRRYRNTILFNDHSGGFSLKDSMTFNNQGSQLLALGDIDNDGDIDVLCTDGQTLKIFHNVNNGKRFAYTNRNMIQFSDINIESKHLQNINIADVNNDQHLDIVLFIDGKKNRVYLNAPEKSLRLWKHQEFGSVKTKGGTVYDFNNDGKNDAIEFTSEQKKGIKAYLNEGLFSTAVPIVNNVPLGSKARFIIKKDRSHNNVFVILGKKTIQQFVFDGKSMVGNSTLSSVAYSSKGVLNHGDFNGDGTSGLLTTSNNKPIITTSTHASGAMSSTADSKYYTHTIVDDFNNDGLVDCLFVSESRQKQYPLTLYLRRTTSGNPSQSNSEDDTAKLNENEKKDEKTNNKAKNFTGSIFTLNNFGKVSRSKLSITNNAYTTQASTPVFDENFRNANSTRLYQSNSDTEIQIRLSKNKKTRYDASTGGLILCMKVPERHQLEIIIFDDNDQKFRAPKTNTQSEEDWQFISIDLRKTDSSFNAAAISRIKIVPTNSATSKYFLSTVFIIQDGTPDPSIVPVMKPMPFPSFNAEKCIKKIKRISRFDSRKIILLSHPILFKHDQYSANLKKAFGAMRGSDFVKGVNSFELGFTNDWIKKELTPNIFGRHRPSVVIFMGLGMQAPVQGASDKQKMLLNHWRKLIKMCDERKILPIVYIGPYTEKNPNRQLQDDLCTAFIGSTPNGKAYPIIDLRGEYFTAKGSFKNGKAKILFNRVAACYHSFKLRCGLK